MARVRISFVDGQTIEYQGISQLSYVSICDKKNVTVSANLHLNADLCVGVGLFYFFYRPQRGFQVGFQSPAGRYFADRRSAAPGSFNMET